MYEDEKIYSGGIVTGIGKINNKLCMIVANDPSVKGGTYYPITVKKHIRVIIILKLLFIIIISIY